LVSCADELEETHAQLLSESLHWRGLEVMAWHGCAFSVPLTILVQRQVISRMRRSSVIFPRRGKAWPGSMLGNVNRDHMDGGHDISKTIKQEKNGIIGLFYPSVTRV